MACEKGIVQWMGLLKGGCSCSMVQSIKVRIDVVVGTVREWAGGNGRVPRLYRDGMLVVVLSQWFILLELPLWGAVRLNLTGSRKGKAF